MSRYLGVDVDITICPSDKGWERWLADRASLEDLNKFSRLDTSPELPYNLGGLFPSVEDPMEYWRNLDYSQFSPLAGSVEALEVLSNYFDIVFISAIKGNHNKSKYYWLKKHFPFMSGYIATKEKFILNNSVVAMIDDRNNQLQGFDITKRIRFNTCYTQDQPCVVVREFDDWSKLSLDKIIEDYV